MKPCNTFNIVNILVFLPIQCTRFFLDVIFLVMVMGFGIFNYLYDENIMSLKNCKVYK